MVIFLYNLFMIFCDPAIFIGGGWVAGHIVSPLSICTSVPSVLYVCNKDGFCSISLEKISVLDSNFIHRYIIIKCRSSLI